MASPGGVVPARLGFLAIFNPSLGNADETIDDQIVYYSSVTTQRHKHRHRSRGGGRPTEHVSREERNERLRQIGLAQGVVEFGKSFSGGRSVETIDAEKSRVVLHELEAGWWILASIDLTKLPLPPKLPTGPAGVPAEEVVEYSTREIKPAHLLLQDLRRAHSIFLLHHDSSLSSFFVRTKRAKFVKVLTRYWDLFLSTWNVMLHGNPARNVFGGINMAASGELGIGVGEEERGSGEREVLEGLVGRIDGLVDLVVSKFGAHDPDALEADDSKEPWLGTGQEPGPDDGAIFLGSGALSRKSLRDVARWMEDLYIWGENAYGVIDSPTSLRKARKAKASSTTPGAAAIRPPIRTPESGGSSRSVLTLAERRGQTIGTVPQARTPEPKTSAPATESSGGNVVAKLDDDNTANAKRDNNGEGGTEAEGDGHHLDKFMSYMKLGYGTYWSIGKSDDAGGASQASSESAQREAKRPKPVDDAEGHYLIGLMGAVEEGSSSEGDDPSSDAPGGEGHTNSRTMLRTVHIELEEAGKNLSESNIVKDLGSLSNEGTPLGQAKAQEFENQDQNKAKKLRVVVYVNKPFIFTFLFQLRTDSLAWDALYRSLHYQLSPLRKPLLASTMYRPPRPDMGPAGASIQDLVWDAASMTVHTTISNIPNSNAQAQLPNPQSGVGWSRAEAINTHMQLLNIYGATRINVTELERTCKTNRGWWIVWGRVLDRPSPLPGLQEQDEEEEPEHGANRGSQRGGERTPTEGERGSKTATPTVTKEVFLIRRASDHIRSRAFSGSYGGGDEAGSTDSAGRLAPGIGVDTRKYIEGLLNLDR